MSRFALIGHPVAGSLSPRLFAAAYGGRYAYDLIEGADFEASWRRFLDGYDGINVTAPFKQAAFRRVDRLSETARLCGAVNLVVKGPSGLSGYNTDVDGVALSVQEAGVAVSRALVVGCGGAGRAAAVAALQLGCAVTVLNRTPSRAEELGAALGCGVAPLSHLADAVRAADLVVYTVPMTLEGMDSVDLSGKVVLEANYKTPCLASAPRCTYISGLRWLLYQAVTGYQLFTGETPNLYRMSCAVV
ncbi:MAG: NAD(P)-binding domain-containing protein [Bacteroidales bacterium]|nr:NAD(P)-binding domain-containing protein [Bacteroidales bacterium]